MIQDKTCLLNVLGMIRIFWMEKNRWPLHAAELWEFSRLWKRPLDFAEFHRLVFIEGDRRDLLLEYVLRRAESSLTDRGLLEINQESLEETTFVWRTHHASLPAKRMERRSYCLVRPNPAKETVKPL